MEEKEIDMSLDPETVVEQEYVRNLQTELKTFLDGMEDIEKSKKNYWEQWLLEDEIYQIMLAENNFVKLDPVFGYEKDPRYWELQKQILAYKYRHEKNSAEGRMQQFDIAKNQIQEQINSAQENLDKILKKEVNEKKEE